MKKLILACLVFTILSNTSLYSQQACTDTNAIYTFEYDGKNYAIVKDGMTWNDTASCSNELGGTLAHINNQAEQNAIWAEIPNAGINNSSTTASDGGNASYLWLGGSDAAEEGKWMWIGENGQNTQFWEGNSSGSAVNGLYSNWGSSNFGGEPDNYLGNQNGLGLAITDWPIGSAGQWNDVSTDNLLFFIVEMAIDTNSGGGTDTTGNGGGTDTTTSVDYNPNKKITLYPNPANNYFRVNGADAQYISMVNTLGQFVKYQNIDILPNIDTSTLKRGLYFVIIEDKKANKIVKKILIE